MTKTISRTSRLAAALVLLALLLPLRGHQCCSRLHSPV